MLEKVPSPLPLPEEEPVLPEPLDDPAEVVSPTPSPM